MSRAIQHGIVLIIRELITLSLTTVAGPSSLNALKIEMYNLRKVFNCGSGKLAALDVGFQAPRSHTISWRNIIRAHSWTVWKRIVVFPTMQLMRQRENSISVCFCIPSTFLVSFLSLCQILLLGSVELTYSFPTHKGFPLHTFSGAVFIASGSEVVICRYMFLIKFWFRSTSKVASSTCKFTKNHCTLRNWNKQFITSSCKKLYLRPEPVRSAPYATLALKPRIVPVSIHAVVLAMHVKLQTNISPRTELGSLKDGVLSDDWTVRVEF